MKLNEKNFKLNEIDKKILKKPIKCLKETHYLYNKLKSVKIFKKFIDSNFKQIVFDLISKLKYKKVKEYNVIFLQGDRPEKFYILLSGSISVLVLNQKNYGKGICPDKKLEKNFIDNPKFFSIKKKGFFLHQIVAKINAGGCFGELGILKRNFKWFFKISFYYNN